MPNSFARLYFVEPSAVAQRRCSGGEHACVGVITGLVYALGLVIIWWAPETGDKPFED